MPGDNDDNNDNVNDKNCFNLAVSHPFSVGILAG